MPGQVAPTTNGEHQWAMESPFIAYSTQADSVMPTEHGLDEKVKALGGEALKDMMKRYPGGRLFTLDGNTSSSSEDDTSSRRLRGPPDQPRKPVVESC